MRMRAKKADVAAAAGGNAGHSYPEGLDVSNHQGAINWRSLKNKGLAFAYAKATEGTSFVDPYFSNNWAGMKSAGLLRGAYHYLRGGLDAERQADIFCDVIGALGDGDLSPAVDIEREGNEGIDRAVMVSVALRFTQMVRARTGRDPVIYSDPSYWIGAMGNTTQFSRECPLWVANWKVDVPHLFGGWSYWTFWQYRSDGTAPGVHGPVCVDRFNGRYSQLEKLAGR